MQAARDGLALLHGEPNTKADSGTSEYSILDSLVRMSSVRCSIGECQALAQVELREGEGMGMRITNSAARLCNCTQHLSSGDQLCVRLQYRSAVLSDDSWS